MFFANWLDSLRRFAHQARVSRRGRRASAGQFQNEAAFEPRVELLEQRQLLTADFVDPNPSPNNGFGQTIVSLSTGNVVVTSYYADVGGTNTGAVYLFNGTTGELISSLFGSTAYDFHSAQIVTLPNGNYLIVCPKWDNGLAVDAGAVTWGSGVSGVSGAISSANSLIGKTKNDGIGDDIFSGRSIKVLSNGNYVVISSLWDNGAAINAGAVTWGNGLTGVSGVVSADNSLVGSTTGDLLGVYGSGPYSDYDGVQIHELTNGNYVVVSKYWSNGTAVNAGAVTWGSGTSGVSGVVSATNSLVGTSSYDGIGGRNSSDQDLPYAVGGIELLPNGNYLVKSVNWSNGGAFGAGAVTWGDGTTGVVGPVSAANSLVGKTAGDAIGSVTWYDEYDDWNISDDRVEVFPNGNYVVVSPHWDNGEKIDAGAVTFGRGDSGVSGEVSSSNSVTGFRANSGIRLTKDDANRTLTANFVRERRIVVGSQEDGFPAEGFSAVVVDGELRINVPSNLGSDVRVTRDSARSQYVVRAYEGKVIVREARFAISSVTRGLLATLGDGADRFDASGVSLAMTIHGGGGNDSIVGSKGDDSIRGESGDDFLIGGAGRDSLNGGDGNDRVDGKGGADTINGELGDDCLIGGDGIDWLIEAADVNFTLTKTTLVGLGTDRLAQFEKAAVFGGDGANVLDASGSNLLVWLVGGFGNDLLKGGSRSDLMDGGDGSDTLIGNAGHDSISGGSGNDLAFGGTGNDCLFGEAGDDTLIGDSGNDQLLGGIDTDTLVGGLGKDTLDGVTGVDQIFGQ